MKIEQILQEFDHLWASLAEGWQRLRNSASSALTPFSSGDDTALPAKSEVDDEFYLPGQGWSMLGGDVFEDDKRFIVRVELPGMEKEDLSVEVVGGSVVIQGEKRFEREQSEGRWRVLQCAYGRFRRSVPLAAAVLADQAKASYRNGVLRVELPKAAPGAPKASTIKLD